MTGANSPLQAAIDVARRTGEFRFDQPIDALPEELRGMPQLRSIILEYTHLTGLPEWMTELDELRFLSMSDTTERVVPLVVTRLHQLHHLAISGLRADALADQIAQLANLETLVLTSCGLRHVPVELAERTALRSLDLSHNALDTGSIFNLPNRLTHLALWGTGLTSLPPVIQTLRNLKVLLLSAHGPTTANETVRRLMPAFDHGLSHPRGSTGGPGQGLTEIPEGLAADCPELIWLDLAGNQLTELPRDIVRLRALRGLVLTANQIEQLPEDLLVMPNLEVLALEHNRLAQVPTRWNTQRLKYVGLSDNPLPVPPEILSRGDTPTAVWEFLTGTRDDRRPLNEAKVLVVGEASVGKTSIIRRLTRGEFDIDERATVGIEVTHWAVPVDGSDIELNLWDFGGQEIMHATHQFFLTRRSVYLLVLNARQNEDQNSIEYWLKIVQSFSDGSPVIVVGNKCEDGLRLDIDRRGLREKYPSIVDFVETSCVDGLGLASLQESIVQTLRRMAHVRDLLPKAYFGVKARLEALEANFLPYDEYVGLCREHGIITPESQESLIRFLHDLGTVLCFREDPRLANTNILNPGWVTGGVYQILNAPITRENRGLLSSAEIGGILDSRDYPADRRGFVIDMMRRFELCYESNDIFLVPDLLTKQEPFTGDWESSLSFSIKYDILPPSVIGRLLVRMSDLIHQGTVWRTGAVLAHDGNRALVKADREDGLLTIHVTGPAGGRRGLLTAIRLHLRAIGTTIPGLATEERVPVPGHLDKWVPYEHLLLLEEAGETTVVPQGLAQRFLISTLLDGIERPRDRERLREQGTSPRPDQPQNEALAHHLTPAQAIMFGTFLVAALLTIIGASVFAVRLVEGQAATVIGLATLAAMAIGLFVLVAGGLIREGTFVRGLKLLLGRRSGRDPA